VNVRVRLFAVARQAAGRDAVEVELPEGATIAELRDRLAIEIPPLTGLLRHMTFAIDAQYVPLGAVLHPGADVACIPPVSGG
jgi:molybdopterin converting factor small subunit